MSATNILWQPQALYLYADAATYDAAGVVIAIGSKIHDIPDARAAFSTRGPGGTWSSYLAEMLAGEPTFDHVLAALPDAARKMHAILGLANAGGEDWQRNFELTTVGWSDEREMLEAWILATNEIAPDAADKPVAHNLPGYEPFRMLQMPVATAQPGVDGFQGILGNPSSMDDLAALDAAAVGLALMEAQRAEKHSPTGRPIHVVGGFCEMLTVTRQGVSRRVLRVWPDEVGRAIDPGAPVTVELIAPRMAAN